MQLFQKSVLSKYLNQLDNSQTQYAYEKFKEFFDNPQIQENIRLDKEEQFQEGFLRELFVDVLGYTINPHPEYNLTTEYKNESGSQKADGAILINGEAIGVIELKSTKTKDLESIRKQAFDYKANHKNCKYVVTSNFEKLRFYINNAVDFEEFDLFNLTKFRFQILYLCLQKDNLLNHLPEKIKEESLVQEEAVTKRLYSDYSEFKRALFDDIVTNNLNKSELTEEQLIEKMKLLFKKTQKLIDRLLFILFCEDRGLLPPNEISKIIDDWKKLKDLDAYESLYSRFKKHFGYINSGYKHDGYVIYAYNGDLFEEDDVLEKLIISDEILQLHTKKLTTYDFESEVDVDILGHIFEQSITEIETVTAEIEGVKFDKNKSRRKKEGVYYTPKYITKYIVDNTVGRLCEEKKNELGILEEEYFKGKKNRKRETILELEQKLNDYQKYLLTLKICDPACGSGAFLNQALVFLIAEHRYISELKSKLFEQPLILSDVENEILEKNLYGVDINEEAVEIAKLSLWLRTAKKGRKLSSLNENIKCGNSLIDDPEVAGDKAFKWEQEFPEVFAKGGFDVVIGNPPYGIQLNNLYTQYLINNYECFHGNFDIYTSFIQLSLNLLKDKSLLAFINPVSWQSGDNYISVRKYICNNVQLKIAMKLPYDVFKDAYIDTGIYVFKKLKCTDYITEAYEFPIRAKNISTIISDIKYKKLHNKDWQLINNLKIVLNPYFYKILKGLSLNSVLLGEISNTARGILPNKEDLLDALDENKKILFIGKLDRYFYSNDFIALKYGDNLREKPKDYMFFIGERILIRRLISRQFRIMATYSDSEFVNKKDIYNLKIINQDYNIKYILSIINSKLISFLKTKGSTTATKDDFSQLTLSDIRQIPIKNISIQDQLIYAKQADFLLKSMNIINENIENFRKYISSKFGIDKLSNKFTKWYELEFNEFLKELNKSRIKLTLSEEAKWMEYFNQQKTKAHEIKAEIDKTDKEIDQRVYELYGLTDEEIKIVEENVKN